MRIAALFLISSGLALAQFPVIGRIVDDIAGAPVPNARVGLLSDAFEIPPETRTNAEGRFALSVPAGAYKIAVEKVGFAAYPNEPVQVRQGSPGELTLILTKNRSLTGRIVDRNGDPIEALLVLFQVNGGLAADGSSSLLNEGRFRMNRLKAGRYYLEINPYISGQRIQFPPPDAIALGESIDLRYQADVSLGDIVPAEATGVEVEGRIQVTDKIKMNGGATVDMLDLSGRTVGRAGGSGAFRFPKVAPGTYYLVANTQVPNYVVFGVQTIQVGSTPLRDILMVLPEPPPVITGRFEIETPNGLAGLGGVGVSAGTTDPKSANPNKQSGSDGRFELSAVSAVGRTLDHRLNIRSGIPADAYIASVTQNGKSATRDPFLIDVSGPVQVLLKRDGALIRGKIALPGNPARPAYVVLAPKERDATLYYRTAPTDRDGVYLLEGIAPGSYDLFVFDRQENYAGEPTLKTYQERATAVTVTAKQELSLSPDIVRIEQ